jgi:hypothetical protein
MPNTPFEEEDAKRARALANQLAVGPCEDFVVGETRCIDRENNVARKRGDGFLSYRPDRMCDACASYLHAEMAALRLEHAIRMDRTMPPMTDDPRGAD